MADEKIQQLLETLVEAVHREPSEPKSPLRRQKIEAASEYDKAETKTNSLLLKIPVVNLVYDVLGDRLPPSSAELKEVLNLMGLLGALMLTISMALPGTISYEELKSTQERFNNASSAYSGIPDMSNNNAIDSLVYYTTVSTNLLGASLVATLLMLVNLSATGGRCREFYKPYVKWWSYARWVFTWAFATLVYGTYSCFQVFNWLMGIKFPDRYVEEHPGSSYKWGIGTYSSFGFVGMMSTIFPAITGLLVTTVLLGIANSAMFIAAQTIDKKVAPRTSKTCPKR